jgi:hypothetical protein
MSLTTEQNGPGPSFAFFAKKSDQPTASPINPGDKPTTLEEILALATKIASNDKTLADKEKELLTRFVQRFDTYISFATPIPDADEIASKLREKITGTITPQQLIALVKIQDATRRCFVRYSSCGSEIHAGYPDYDENTFNSLFAARYELWLDTLKNLMLSALRNEGHLKFPYPYRILDRLKIDIIEKLETRTDTLHSIACNLKKNAEKTEKEYEEAQKTTQDLKTHIKLSEEEVSSLV